MRKPSNTVAEVREDNKKLRGVVNGVIAYIVLFKNRDCKWNYGINYLRPEKALEGKFMSNDNGDMAIEIEVIEPLHPVALTSDGPCEIKGVRFWSTANGQPRYHSTNFPDATDFEDFKASVKDGHRLVIRDNGELYATDATPGFTDGDKYVKEMYLPK